MLKVMIIDDEKLIVEGLKQIIDWSALGLEINHACNDGACALEQFKTEKSDIVITDITMPKMDGLSLIENIKNIDNSVKFIILSGYDDFNYAKKAISLGIENYILKPIDEDELEETLNSTIEKINREAKEPYFKEEDIETIKENIYNRWITNTISQFELEEREFLLDIDLKYKNYCAALLKLQKSEERAREVFGLIESLNEKYSGKSITFFKDIEDNLVIINGWNDKDNGIDEFHDMLEDIIKFINEKLHDNVFVTIGESERLSTNVYKSYELSKKLQNYLLVYGYNRIIKKEDVLQNTDNKDKFKVDLDEFYKLLISRDVQSISKYIENIFDKMRDTENINPDIIRNVAADMMYIIRKTAIELNIDSSENYDDMTRTVLSVCSKETIDEIKDYIKKESEKVLEDVKMRNYQLTPVVQKVVSYVNENYKEEMSLKILADKFNMNTSYLGQIFSKEIGLSFSEYLNKIKNEKAKELLLNTNMRINEISKEVGYIDTSYFYKKFKKYFGVSPNILRSSKKY